jgi:hypothetical protein
MIDILLFPIRLVLGLVLFAASKSFRDLVRGKLRSGTDDTVSSGEEIVMVLKKVELTGDES